MPRAVVDVTANRYQLKTCPPDGYVELRRMSYDKWLHRTDISMQMQLQMQSKSKGGTSGSMQLQNQAVTYYEFKSCIVGHNLEDANGNLLDFNQKRTLDMLDPRVGNEIGRLIEELHEPFTEEEEGNS